MVPELGNEVPAAVNYVGREARTAIPLIEHHADSRLMLCHGIDPATDMEVVRPD